LTGQGGDALVVRHHVAAQRLGDGLTIRPGHHAAAVQRDAQARQVGSSMQQWRGGVTPTAERVVDIVQGSGLHGRAS